MTLLYEKESYEIRGACFWIWKEFGSAFKEAIIDRALTEELNRRGLKVENQKRIDIYYQGKKMGTYIPDKVVNNAIIIEVKAKSFLTKQDIKQFWHYLKATEYKLGFLINFGERLEIKRVVYEKARISTQVKYADPIADPDPHEDLRSRSAWVSAFTLIELLIYLAIVGMAATALVLFSIGISDTRGKSYVGQEVQANGRMALNIISQRIRAATGVNTGSSTFGSDPGVLSLAMAEAAKNPTILDLTANDGSLRIQEGSPTPTTTILTSNKVKVTNLTFTNLTNTSPRENIRVQLTVEYNNPSGEVEYNYSQTFQTTVSVRQ